MQGGRLREIHSMIIIELEPLIIFNLIMPDWCKNELASSAWRSMAGPYYTSFLFSSQWIMHYNSHTVIVSIGWCVYDWVIIIMLHVVISHYALIITQPGCNYYRAALEVIAWLWPLMLQSSFNHKFRIWPLIMKTFFFFKLWPLFIKINVGYTGHGPYWRLPEGEW